MSREKIPCSVSMLTLNAEDSLRECLEGLKDFDEIIIADGNSTDRTREIAAEYGVKIIKQYDTDEPNIPCAMDKAAVRTRAMNASTREWRFFMDADDTLSPEVVEEIRSIVTQKQPQHLIWRMPTRIFIDGHEILHEATYPSYQTRLVHKKVNVRFKGPVHDHFVFDAKHFPVGTMQHYYNFQWSKERVANYHKYLYTYIQRELQTAHFHRMTLSGFLYWGVYWRARIFLGYVLWRLPVMYARYGFRDSMPLPLELQIAGQHAYLLIAGIGRFTASRRWFVYATRILVGDTRASIARDLAIRDWEAYGHTLDINGDTSKSYWRYLLKDRWCRPVVMQSGGESSVEKEPFDTVLLFSEDALTQMREAYDFLRIGGTLVGATRSNPVDTLIAAGFNDPEIIRAHKSVFVFRAQKSQ